MILGLATPLTYRTPEEWARKHKALGCKAVVFPVDCTATESEIEAFHKAASESGKMYSPQINTSVSRRWNIPSTSFAWRIELEHSAASILWEHLMDQSGTVPMQAIILLKHGI